MTTLLTERAVEVPAEEREDTVTAAHRFDIPLLASRLLTSAAWAAAVREDGGLRVC